MQEVKRKIQLCVIAKNQGKPMALLLKTNLKRGSFWQNITGGVDEGEKYAQAALREFTEETHQEVSKNFPHEFISLEMKFKFKKKNKQIKEKVFALICQDIFEVKIDPKEHDDYKWVELKKIKRSHLEFKSNYTPLKICRNILV